MDFLDLTLPKVFLIIFESIKEGCFHESSAEEGDEKKAIEIIGGVGVCSSVYG